jgi:hypothetical protein
VTKAPVPPSQFSSVDVPAELERIILSCLAKHPDERPITASALARDLKNVGIGGSWSDDRAAAWWKEFRSNVEHGANVDAGMQTITIDVGVRVPLAVEEPV